MHELAHGHLAALLVELLREDADGFPQFLAVDAGLALVQAGAQLGSGGSLKVAVELFETRDQVFEGGAAKIAQQRLVLQGGFRQNPSHAQFEAFECSVWPAVERALVVVGVDVEVESQRACLLPCHGKLTVRSPVALVVEEGLRGGGESLREVGCGALAVESVARPGGLLAEGAAAGFGLRQNLLIRAGFRQNLPAVGSLLGDVVEELVERLT